MAGQSLKQALDSMCKNLAFVSANESRKPQGDLSRTDLFRGRPGVNLGGQDIWETETLKGKSFKGASGFLYQHCENLCEDGVPSTGLG